MSDGERIERGSPEWLRLFVRRTNVPRRLAELDLKDMNCPDPDYAEAIGEVERALERLVDPGEPPTFLKLRGAIGGGKTRAAVWLLRELYAASYPICGATCPLFLRASALVDLRFRALSPRDDDEEEDRREVLRGRLESASLVVLDDVARVEGFRGEEHYVERVIETRVDLDRPTILTLNSVDGLSARFRDLLEEFESVVLAPERSFRRPRR